MIVAKHSDGKYYHAYCHWDGYPDYILPKLTKFWSSQEKAEELTKSPMSCLGKPYKDDTSQVSDYVLSFDEFDYFCTSRWKYIWDGVSWAVTEESK